MKRVCVALFCLLIPLLFISCSPTTNNSNTPYLEEDNIMLPEPTHEGTNGVEEAISSRISRRQFSDQAVNVQELSQILWAAQGKGIDGTTGATRTAPSAGATYPVEIFVIAGELKVERGIPAGVYHYNPSNHKLIPVLKEDQRKKLAQAALQQEFIAKAPVSIVLTAEYERTTRRYGERGRRYVHIEIGHITQNIHLQVESLGLGSVAVGAFDDNKLSNLLKTEFEPLMIIPFGRF